MPLRRSCRGRFIFESPSGHKYPAFYKNVYSLADFTPVYNIMSESCDCDIVVIRQGFTPRQKATDLFFQMHTSAVKVPWCPKQLHKLIRDIPDDQHRNRRLVFLNSLRDLHSRQIRYGLVCPRSWFKQELA